MKNRSTSHRHRKAASSTHGNVKEAVGIQLLHAPHL